MGVISSMHTAVSGLSSHGKALGVTADNIANASTTGFKTSRAEFHDMMARSMVGHYGGNQVGRGSKVANVRRLIHQGSIDNTGRATDLAINGNGFFVMDGSMGRTYSRNGEFHFDKDGWLITTDNQKIKGFEIDEQGNKTNKLKDIRLPRSLVPARPTTQVRLDMNLDSRVPADLEKVIDMNDPYKKSDFVTGTEVFDSQGNSHILTMAFNKLEAGKWAYKVLGNSKEIVGADPQFNYGELESGTLQFDAYGKLTTQTTEKKNYSFVNAIPNQEVNVDFGDPTSLGGTGLRGARQFGYVSDMLSWSQDGATAGSLNGLAFSDSGVLTVQYSNGEAEDIASVAVARFENPEGLTSVGNSKMKQTRESGGAGVGHADRGGRGQVIASALERSTTDIASEFVDMIKTQRHFQANAKSITTSDEMLLDVINIKR